MNGTKVVIAGQLEALRSRVACWRAERGGRRLRVPEEIWDEAVEVARTEGVCATSRATGLGYYALKDRMERVVNVGASEGSSRSFVEVTMPVRMTDGAASRTVLELEGRNGGRLRVELTGTSTVDVVGLAQAFWSGQP